jgi:hypothetical protein
MENDDHTYETFDEAAEERQRRREALRALGQHEAPAGADAAGSPTTRAPAQSAVVLVTRGRGRTAFRIALVVGLCAAVAGGVLWHALAAPHASSPPAPHPVTFALATAGLACPSAAAWSPDGKRIAVVGYSGACEQPFASTFTYQPGALVIYDAAAGASRALLSPDKALPFKAQLASPKDEGNGHVAVTVVQYLEVLWSPTGDRIAIQFTTFTVVNSTVNGGPPPTISPGVDGIELLNVASAAAQVMTMPASASGGFIADLLTGQWASSAPLPPATSYAWSAGDRLVTNGSPLTTQSATPATPLAPLVPIGNPDGGLAFTTWQPMTAAYFGATFAGQQSPPLIPGVITVAPLMLAWSPDGRYIERGGVRTLLVQPTDAPLPGTQVLAALGIGVAPNVPMRDAGMQHALSDPMFTPLGGFATQLLAWRPDGKILAAQVVSNGESPLGATTVKLYSCQSGNLLATFTPAHSHNVFEPNAQYSTYPVSLLWSPDGARLLALNLLTTTVTIWPSALLPH